MLDKLTTAREKFIMTERQPFNENRQKFLQQNIKGVMGSTWDASHLTSFLNRSFYSNKRSPQKDDNPQRKSYSLRRKKSGDFFFKNLRYDQNKSNIGYTKVNPLVANVQISRQRQKVLVDFFLSRTQKLHQTQRQKSPSLRCSQNEKFKFQGNQVKFRATDPLTSRYEPQKPQKIGYSIQRMKRQIASRHPHGITGIDNPQNCESKFYESSKEKQLRVRLEPLSKTSFQLDRQWKRKKRATPISEQFRFRHTECIRKFRNQNVHGYNIVTNRKADE